MTQALSIAAGLFSILLAAGVLLRRKRTPAQWAFAAGMALLAAEALLSGLSATSQLPVERALWQFRRSLALASLPGTWLLFALCYSRGNHPEFLRRWWPVVAGAYVVPLGLVLWAGRGLAVPTDEVALVGGWFVALGPLGKAVHCVFLVGVVLVLMNLERTLRTAVGTMRWRIKFMVVGLGVLFGARFYTSSQAYLYSAVNLAHTHVEAGALLLGCVLIALSLLRSGLFEIDVYPSQRLLHNSLTVLLAGAYLLVVGVLSRLVGEWGGVAGFPLRALLVLFGLVGLAVLLLSDRIRQYTKRFVSRHLQRPFHDYRQVWTVFTARTASLVDEASLSREVVKLVSETFEVLSVTIWLTDESQTRLALGASTLLSEEKAAELVSAQSNVAPMLTGILELAQPFDLDQASGAWVESLKQCHPDYFQKGGNRVCVPLIAGGRLLGLMTVGDRVSGMQLSWEDLDLLKCIGDQVATYLLNIHLSKRLLQAKEMEAFQTMSAFFVHDLKNAASTLSLMLQNLPRHFDNPDFRADALRGIGKTVERINGLIRSLTLLRQAPEMHRAEADLNALVAATLDSMRGDGGQTVTRQLGEVPRLVLDADQFQKVLTNLVLNARDAVPKDGWIRVATAREDGWAVLTVEDNGCGMSSDFVNRSLFRPFQTTKKKGIGIGMFHCKAIVEAHRGRIEVRSEPGKGTAFKVLLPLMEEKT